MAVIADRCPDVQVTVVDLNAERIAAWNDADLSRLPVYEPGLDAVVGRARGRNLHFTTEVDAAIADAVKRTSEALENLENFIEELRVGLEVHAGETNDLPKRLDALKTVSKERLAGMWFQAGDRDKALKLAKEAVDGGAQQVHPLAVLTELQWKAGKTNEALATFATLRGLAAWMDTDLPLVRRLAPVIAASGALASAKDWQPAPTYPADSGTRPALDTLGSFRWNPQAAPPLEVSGSDGKPIRLSDYHGRPVLLVFYLGGGCLHCVEQLRLLAQIGRAHV